MDRVALLRRSTGSSADILRDTRGSVEAVYVNMLVSTVVPIEGRKAVRGLL